jgi:hypothetical protein
LEALWRVQEMAAVAVERRVEMRRRRGMCIVAVGWD